MPIRKPPKISARQRKQAEAAQEQSPRMYVGRGLEPYGYAGAHPRKQPQPKPGKR
jgi:hypothetical protein